MGELPNKILRADKEYGFLFLECARLERPAVCKRSLSRLLFWKSPVEF